MKNKKTLLIIIIAFVALIAGASLLYGYLGDKVERTEIAVNEQTATNSPTQQTSPPTYAAPDFSAYDINGNKVNLSDFIGKPIILNFWASWCGPCKSEMPAFSSAYEKYKNDIHFLMVNLTDGSRETVEMASSFIKSQGYTFPIYYDKDMDAAMTYNVYAVPATYFIDKGGNLIAHTQSAISAQTLQKGIDMIYTQQ